MTTTKLFTLLQLSDGTFPSGGFAHSGGLEATSVLAQGASVEVDAFLDSSVRNAARAILPFVFLAHRSPEKLAVADEGYDATVPLAFVNHASRAQGRALLSAARRVWETECSAIETYARQPEAPAHHGPVFGAIFGVLGIPRMDTASAYLHGVARGILSSAIRLGLIGPLEAQRLISERATRFAELVERASTIDTQDAAQSAPVIEIFAALHDRLDGRMFQS